MSARVLSQLVALGFILLGILAFSMRYYSRTEAKIALQDSLWRLSYDVDFDVTGPVGNLRVSLPTSSPAADFPPEELSTTNLEEEIKVAPISENRELIVTSQSTGTYEVKAEFEIRLRPRYSWDVQSTLASLTASAKTRFTGSDDI